jgi:mannose-1-phosphate guanylyltransferase
VKAVVLSAGYGTRLGGLTRDQPKALLPVAGRPLLEHVIRNLARHGFDEIAVNLHFRAELIRERFGDGSALGVRLTYSYEPELLGTAGTIGSLRAFLASGQFAVHYGDVLTDHDFSGMLAFHRRHQAVLTLLAHERPGSNSVAVLDEEGRLVQFVERPAANDPVRRRSSWANSGACICDPRVLDLLPDPPSDLARDLLPRLAARGDVYAYPLSGMRIAVDSPARYREAQQMLAETARGGGVGS